MIRTTRALAGCLAVVALATGCVTIPTGPSVTVLPGTGQSFNQFQADDASCRQFASQQAGVSTNQAGVDNTVGGATLGTLLGAAAGAAIGAVAGSPGTGAAVGAGFGLLGGTAVGAGNAQTAQVSVQQRYDAGYVQCMYAKGHQVPVRASQRPYTQSAVTPPAGPPPPPPPPAAKAPATPARVVPPPPPAGTPPPPPPTWSR